MTLFCVGLILKNRKIISNHTVTLYRFKCTYIIYDILKEKQRLFLRVTTLNLFRWEANCMNYISTVCNKIIIIIILSYLVIFLCDSSYTVCVFYWSWLLDACSSLDYHGTSRRLFVGLASGTITVSHSNLYINIIVSIIHVILFTYTGPYCMKTE